MIKQKWIMFLVLLVITQTVAGCGQQPPTVPPACPPIAGPISATVTNSPGDVSSVTVPNGTTGEYEAAAGGGYWCTPNDLKTEKVNVNDLIANYGCFNLRSDTTPPCTPYSALAAINVEPSKVKFNSSPKPSLRYDLTKPDNQPVCTKEGTNCGGYQFYQLKDPVPTSGTAWLAVGQAWATTYNGKSVAEGDINHFSTFALVELPTPQPVNPPLLAQMIVDSDFMADDQKGIRVSFEIVQSSLPETGQTRLFRFSNVDPAWANADLPAECKSLATSEEQLTCFFPIGTSVSVELGVNNVNNMIRIVSNNLNSPVELYANVEIY